MSDNQSSIRPSSKRDFHNKLKEDVGVKALETVPSDSERKNIPEPVTSS